MYSILFSIFLYHYHQGNVKSKWNWIGKDLNNTKNDSRKRIYVMQTIADHFFI